MKNIISVISLGFVFACSQANAGIECISKVSNSVTTPDYHCSNHCGDWANTRPMQTLILDMDKKFKDMGAFFKNPSSACSGGGLCGFSSIPAPTISARAEQVRLDFKTWSKPVVVSVSADICVFNNATSSAPATPSSPTLPRSSTPHAQETPVAIRPPIPPQQKHDIEEAGSLGDNCSRMKENWLVDAKNYCSPYNVNLAATVLNCSQRSDALFRKVSGVFICTQ